MSGAQQTVLILGVFLIVLSVRRVWKPEVEAIF